ncbi:hypothetical protein [Kutzneria sp. NPDC052558]|uniref:hypothetical protein n=1 Tax=Kutzneria sp. NPDC052558 TaxID=3364121 RepID=UPI0037C9B8E7
MRKTIVGFAVLITLAICAGPALAAPAPTTGAPVVTNGVDPAFPALTDGVDPAFP